VGYTIELYLEQSYSNRIIRLWNEVDSSLPEMGVRPHISLAGFEAVDEGTIINDLEHFADQTDPFSVTFSSVGVFPTDEAVVFLAPVVTQELLDIHRMYHGRLNTFEAHPYHYYKLGVWVPHCTIAQDVKRSRVSPIVCQSQFSPVFGQCQITAIGLISYQPVQQLCRYSLSLA
jgi:2'-5' RNA ligase